MTQEDVKDYDRFALHISASGSQGHRYDFAYNDVSSNVPTQFERLVNAMPILDGDQLIPHPTPTTLTTISYLPTTPPCFNVQQTPAWWCTIGDAAGRELPTGHRRQLIATTKSVFINGRRLGRFADPFGTGTMPLPCSSRVGGSSPNVFVGI